jgi:hypothetical protein
MSIEIPRLLMVALGDRRLVVFTGGVAPNAELVGWPGLPEAQASELMEVVGVRSGGRGDWGLPRGCCLSPARRTRRHPVSEHDGPDRAPCAGRARCE